MPFDRVAKPVSITHHDHARLQQTVASSAIGPIDLHDAMPDIDACYSVGHAHSGSSDFEGDLKELRATVRDSWEGARSASRYASDGIKSNQICGPGERVSARPGP